LWPDVRCGVDFANCSYIVQYQRKQVNPRGAQAVHTMFADRSTSATRHDRFVAPRLRFAELGMRQHKARPLVPAPICGHSLFAFA
jgi:hypothetical protein